MKNNDAPTFMESPTMLMKHSLILSLAILLLAPFLAFGQGQDLLKLYPENYKVIMENDRVRGLDFRLRKGAKENSHDHPAHVVYVLTGFKIRFTFPDGKTGIPRNQNRRRFVQRGRNPWLRKHRRHRRPRALSRIEDTWRAKDRCNECDRSKPPHRHNAYQWHKEGKEDELKRELLALAAPTRAEAGNIQYDLYQSPTKKNQFMRLARSLAQCASLGRPQGDPEHQGVV
jgi:hypothetical protein